MARQTPLKFDTIGRWSELKLEIVRNYAKAYSTILTAQEKPRLYHVYIDGFAGAGRHLRKKTKEFVLGSPLNALLVKPPFREFYFIDLDKNKADNLREETAGRTDVHIFQGDCNKLLLESVFPNVRYRQYRRGLCLLDPYGLHLNWDVIQAAGQERSIDMFLNFPVMDMNRNALWAKPENLDEANLARMTAFWGDDSWRTVLRKK